MQSFITRQQILFRLAIVACALLVGRHTAVAADFFWNNPAGGVFTIGSNWTPTGPPKATDNAIFNLGTSGYSVNGGQGNLIIRNDTVSFPAFGAANVLIGDETGSQGTMTSNGGILNVNIAAASPTAGLFVGVNGAGTLGISANSIFNIVGRLDVGQNAGSQGSVTVDGSTLGTPGFGGTSLESTIIGDEGNGALLATNNSKVNLNGPFVVGQAANSQGIVTVNHSTLGSPGFGNDKVTLTTIGASPHFSPCGGLEGGFGGAWALWAGRCGCRRLIG